MIEKKKQNDLLLKYLNLGQLGFVETSRNSGNLGNRYAKNYGEAVAYLEFSIFQNKFYGISGWIEFPKVELILEESLANNNFETQPRGGTFSPYYIIRGKVGDPIQKKHSDAQQIEFLNEDNIRKVANMVLEVIVDMYFPIFEKFSKLITIDNEIIAKLPHLEVANYINLHMPFKKLIIMKLCNNPEYDTYCEWLSNLLKERHDRGERPEYYRLFVDLRNRLESEY